MSIITPAQASRLGNPPKPLPPHVRLVDPQGRPTREFHDFLTKLYEWQRMLVTILTE